MSNSTSQLKRGLKNRHIQLIAMGGAVGTGLFLGSAQVIQSAGPSIILGLSLIHISTIIDEFSRVFSHIGSNSHNFV